MWHLTTLCVCGNVSDKGVWNGNETCVPRPKCLREDNAKNCLFVATHPNFNKSVDSTESNGNRHPSSIGRQQKTTVSSRLVRRQELYKERRLISDLAMIVAIFGIGLSLFWVHGLKKELLQFSWLLRTSSLPLKYTRSRRASVTLWRLSFYSPQLYSSHWSFASTLPKSRWELFRFVQSQLHVQYCALLCVKLEIAIAAILRIRRSNSVLKIQNLQELDLNWSELNIIWDYFLQFESLTTTYCSSSWTTTRLRTGALQWQRNVGRNSFSKWPPVLFVPFLAISPSHGRQCIMMERR